MQIEVQQNTYPTQKITNRAEENGITESSAEIKLFSDVKREFQESNLELAIGNQIWEWWRKNL